MDLEEFILSKNDLDFADLLFFLKKHKKYGKYYLLNQEVFWILSQNTDDISREILSLKSVNSLKVFAEYNFQKKSFIKKVLMGLIYPIFIALLMTILVTIFQICSNVDIIKIYHILFFFIIIFLITYIQIVIFKKQFHNLILFFITYSFINLEISYNQWKKIFNLLSNIYITDEVISKKKSIEDILKEFLNYFFLSKEKMKQDYKNKIKSNLKEQDKVIKFFTNVIMLVVGGYIIFITYLIMQSQINQFSI